MLECSTALRGWRVFCDRHRYLNYAIGDSHAHIASFQSEFFYVDPVPTPEVVLLTLVGEAENLVCKTLSLSSFLFRSIRNQLFTLGIDGRFLQDEPNHLSN